MDLTTKKISAAEFRAKCKATGLHKDAVFQGCVALMNEIYSTGYPIYCDQSYYVHEQNYDRVEKVGNHFECAGYKEFERWRDCHYYTLYKDDEGHAVWLMTGGRY